MLSFQRGMMVLFIFSALAIIDEASAASLGAQTQAGVHPAGPEQVESLGEAASSSPSYGSADSKSLEVYIDPITGQRTAPPATNIPSTTVLPAGQKVPVRSSQLSIPANNPKVYNLGPGKGRAIDMRGRLKQVESHIEPDGKVLRQCDVISSPAPTGQ